jgi:Putative peptidoglycan binding domain
MNSKKIILLGCVAACVFAASTATAQMRGHGGSMPRMGMRGPPMSHSMGGMGMRGGFMPQSMGRMPMHRGPMMNSPSGFRRFGNRDFNRNDRFGRFNRFNDGRFVRNHRFHHFNHFNHFNNVVFIGDFGFPWWWGWGWGPSWGWGSGYPYGYYGGYNYGGYGSGYGYSDSSGSRVAELQSRLASAGYYHGAIDGIMGPATRRAIRAYERDHGYAG